MTTRERRALSAYSTYKCSTDTSLSDVYDSYSTAKAQAWRYCEDLMAKHDGWGLRIISHNVYMFTAGFEFLDPETGALMFMYITQTYGQAVEVQPMRVWECKNLEDGATFIRPGLRSVLIAMRFHELITGHFRWKLRSYVKKEI